MYNLSLAFLALSFVTCAAVQTTIRLVCKGSEVHSTDDEVKPFETSLIIRQTGKHVGSVSLFGVEMSALFVDDMITFSDDKSTTGIRMLTSGSVDRTTGGL